MESSQFLGNILNSLPDAICVIDTVTHKVRYVNDTFSNELLSRHIIVGQSFENQILHDDSKELFTDSFQAATFSPHDVTIGVCKSLSSVGSDKCKNMIV